MTALGAAGARQIRNLQGSCLGSYPVKTSSVIYQGGLVNIDVNGRASAATAVGAQRCIGVGEENATGNTAGTVYCSVRWGHEALFATATALTTSFVTANVVVKDDNTVQTAASYTTAVKVFVGEYVQKSGTSAWIAIRRFADHAGIAV